MEADRHRHAAHLRATARQVTPHPQPDGWMHADVSLLMILLCCRRHAAHEHAVCLCVRLTCLRPSHCPCCHEFCMLLLQGVCARGVPPDGAVAVFRRATEATARGRAGPLRSRAGCTDSVSGAAAGDGQEAGATKLWHAA